MGKFGFLEPGLFSHAIIVDGVWIDGNGLGYLEKSVSGSSPFEGLLRSSDRPRGAMMFLLIVQKMRQALTFLATIENDDRGMKALAVISILALLTISGAAYTDRLLTNDRQAAQEVN
jgi:hypothetical protein